MTTNAMPIVHILIPARVDYITPSDCNHALGDVSLLGITNADHLVDGDTLITIAITALTTSVVSTLVDRIADLLFKAKEKSPRVIFRITLLDHADTPTFDLSESDADSLVGAKVQIKNALTEAAAAPNQAAPADQKAPLSGR